MFSDAVAAAYQEAGGASRLFSGNETTQAIAQREFQQALKRAMKDTRTALPAALERRLLSP
jgi:hypothetical protein